MSAEQHPRRFGLSCTGALRGCGLLLLCAAPATSAFAHDAPLIQRIVWRTDVPDVLLQTNRGLIFGDPGSRHWRLLCREVLHIPTTELATLAYLPSGRLLVATSSGLRRTDDDGCTWQSSFPSLLIPAMAQDPVRPERLYIATFPLGMASEKIGGDSTIRASDDGGDSWTELQVLPDNDFVNGLRVAPSDPTRVYASGGVYHSDHREFYIARSQDSGASWERFVVPVAKDDNNILLLAVSPVDPNIVLVKVVPGEPSMIPERLLISRDGGETFSNPTGIMVLRDAAFSADGMTVWLAGKEGLFRSSDGGDSFERAGGGAEMSCAVEHEGSLHACGRYEGLMTDGNKNGVGRSADLGDSYEPWMTFQDVTEPVNCGAGSSTTAICGTPWSDWEYEVANMFSAASLLRDGGTPISPSDAGSDPDAGVPLDAAMMGPAMSDASTDAAVSARPAGDSGGCSVMAPRRTRHGVAWTWFGSLWLLGLLGLRALRALLARL